MLEIESNLNLIRKIVWGFVKNNPNGLEFDDLFSEACLACLEAAAQYDPDRGQESTYIYRVVCNGLHTFLNQRTLICIELTEVLLTDSPGPEDAYLIEEHWQEIMTGLSPEAHAVLQLVMDGSMLTDRTPKQQRGQIVVYLRKHGWPWSRIWGAFREIRVALA